MRILVAEDEHRIANAMKKGLEQEHYAVDVVYDGSEAFDLASTEDYDAIILDLLLPGLDGINICRTLRQHKIHTPILVLTAKNQTDDKILGLDAGADDYMTKPFSFEELLARLRALLRRPAQLFAESLKVADLILDPKEYVVSRADQAIHLSNREFAVLYFLMRHPNQVQTKEKIMSHVWEYDANILPNTLEVTIKNLRQKVDRPFPHLTALIQTVRGYGYKIGVK